MRTGLGSMFRELRRWVVRVRLGWLGITRETFRLDNVESEVVGGACGAADRGGISKNGSNKYSRDSFYDGLRSRIFGCKSNRRKTSTI